MRGLRRDPEMTVQHNASGLFDLTYCTQGCSWTRGEASGNRDKSPFTTFHFKTCVGQASPHLEKYTAWENMRNLSSLQHPETTLETTLRNIHRPTSLSWVDKHWDDLRMYLLLISFTPIPLNLPASVPHPALSLYQVFLRIMSFITLCNSLAPPSPHLPVILGCENMAARSWWEKGWGWGVVAALA